MRSIEPSLPIILREPREFSPDFAALDGERFEDLCEDLFKAMGFNDPPPERSGRGPDGGRDIIVTEHRKSGISGIPRPFRWLVQCKNFAKANKSVRPRDVGSIVDKLARHNADGYLLVTSTLPSTDVEADISAIDQSTRFPVEASYWARSRLVDEVRKHRSVHEKYFGAVGPEGVRPVHWSKRNPFMELFAYDEVQSGYFFGRDADTRNIVGRVYSNSIVVLYGESGVGKTSLINAGILPLLQKEGTTVLRIAAKPDFSSQDLLEHLRQVASALPGINADVLDSVDALVYPLAQALRQDEQKLVIVFDQFEILFSSESDSLTQVGHDVANLISTARQFDSVAVLISLRSDYLNELGIWAMECQMPDLLASAYPLRKLTVAQATEILAEVPPIVDAEFSPELTRSMITDLQELDRGEVYPPNLQIVANKVFGRARANADPSADKLIVRGEDYETVGTARGVLEAFLNDKLANLGKDQDLAREILLALVSATGRRLNLTTEAIAERVSSDLETLMPIFESLTQLRLIKPTDQPDVFELVHDVLATRILEMTDVDQRKAKAAREAFELALTTWHSEGVLESGERLDWYYQYHQYLELDVDALVFLLLSDTSTILRGDPFQEFFSSARRAQEVTRGRWIEAVDPPVCIQALDRVLELGEAGDIAQPLAYEIASDICTASHLEVQRKLVAKLESLSPHVEDTLLAQAYRGSALPNQATLSYLQGIARRDIPFDVKYVLGYRILEHYRRTFSSVYNPLPQGEVAIQEWRGKFPLHLLADISFQGTVFRYLKESTKSRGYGLRKYRLELLQMLYEHDPNRTVEVLWEMAHRTPYFGRTLHINRETEDVMQLLRVYDPERTVKEIVTALQEETHYLSDKPVAFLESLEAPEADELLVLNVQRYVEKFENGSKTWRGWGLRYWRKSLRDTVEAAVRRELDQVVPSLIKIVSRAEPANVKLTCVKAMVAMGSEEQVWPILVKLLNDRSSQVRKLCARQLLKIQQHRHHIVNEIANSLTEESRPNWAFFANRHSSVMGVKIDFLRRSQDSSAIGLLDSIAGSQANKEIAEQASRAAAELRKSAETAT